MSTYVVEVIRHSYGFHVETVEARSVAEAEQVALEAATNHVISDAEADYEVWDTREVEG